MTEKGLTDDATLARYRHAWAHAAERTPHGTPIELSPPTSRAAQASSSRPGGNAESAELVASIAISRP